MDSAHGAETKTAAEANAASSKPVDRETVDETDGGIGKVGYEINFNRVFFKYQPPRPLEEIDADLADVEKTILKLLGEVTK